MNTIIYKPNYWHYLKGNFLYRIHRWLRKCFPVTKEFREKLYMGIVSEYDQAREKNQNRVRENAGTQMDTPNKQQDREAPPFR